MGLCGSVSACVSVWVCGVGVTVGVCLCSVCVLQ